MLQQKMQPKLQTPEAMIEYEIKQLFERHTIPEIRLREQATREEIEAKSQDLRKLVGTRYRDLIDSADSVIAMKEAASQMTVKIEQIETGCTSLLSRVRKQPDSQKQEESAHSAEDRTLQRRKMYHLARQIKLLVDAPEQIWSSMEECDFFSATLLYTHAEQVHSNLITEEHSSQLLTSIPLVIRQWGLISQFPGEIKYKSRQQIKAGGVSSEHYAGSLCSLMLLDNLSPVEAFRAFLTAQKEAVLSVFDSPTSLEASVIEDITDKVCRLIGLIHCSLFHMGSIFSPSFATSCYGAETPLLWGLLQQAFQPLHNKEPSLNTGPTVSFALSCLSMKGLLSDEVVQDACCAWLKDCASKVKEVLGKLLISHVHHATDLMRMHQVFLAAIGEPPYPPLLQGSETSKHTNVIVSEKICELVLHLDVDMWSLFFGDIFLDASKNIIKRTFETLSLDVDPYLATAHEDMSVGQQVWGKIREKENIQITKLEASAVTPKVNTLISHLDKQLESAMEDLKFLIYESSNAAREHGHGDPGSSKRKHESDAIIFIWFMDEDEEDMEDEDTRESQKKLAKARRIEGRKQRLLLRDFLQQTCFETVSSLLQALKSKVDDIVRVIQASGESEKEKESERDTNSTEDAIDRILFLGRLCRAISEQSVQLHRIFQEDPLSLDTGVSRKKRKKNDKGKPFMSTKLQNILQRRLAQKEAQFESSLRTGAASDTNPRLQQLLIILRQLFLRAHARWARYAASTYGSELKHAIRDDDWSDSEKKRMWHGTTVAVAEPVAGGAQEEAIPLPYQPSTYVLSFLYSVCKEIYRVSAHTPDKVALHYYAHLLLEEVIHCYRNALDSDRAQKMCKEAVVQVSFDTRLLFEILSGGYTFPEDEDLHAALKMDEEIVNSQQSLRKSAEALSLHIESCLDPIDRAFYGPHLSLFVEQCYGRCCSLLGFLRMLHPTPSAVSKYRPMKQEQHNALSLATPCTRFRYLPITSPAAAPQIQPTTPTTTSLDTHATHTASPPQSGSTPTAGRGASLSLFEQVGRRFGSLV